MAKQDDKTPQAVQACHDLIEWVIPQIDKFPRSRRFTLGERIESGLLQTLPTRQYGHDSGLMEGLGRQIGG